MTKEKKQIVVLVSLVAVVGSVGAFQFLNKGPSTEAVVAKADKTPVVADPTTTVKRNSVMDYFILEELEERDPFIPQAILVSEPRNATGQTVPPLIRRPGTEITGGGEGPVNPPGPHDPGIGDVQIGSGRPLGALSLRGVIIGPRPMAVFEGETGRQVLVGEGKTLPNGAVLISIAEGKVILKKNGKIQTIEFEEAYS